MNLLHPCDKLEACPGLEPTHLTSPTVFRRWKKKNVQKFYFAYAELLTSWCKVKVSSITSESTLNYLLKQNNYWFTMSSRLSYHLMACSCLVFLFLSTHTVKHTKNTHKLKSTYTHLIPHKHTCSTAQMQIQSHACIYHTHTHCLIYSPQTSHLADQ